MRNRHTLNISERLTLGVGVGAKEKRNSKIKEINPRGARVN